MITMFVSRLLVSIFWHHPFKGIMKIIIRYNSAVFMLNNGDYFKGEGNARRLFTMILFLPIILKVSILFLLINKRHFTFFFIKVYISFDAAVWSRPMASNAIDSIPSKMCQHFKAIQSIKIKFCR